ncbi:MAG: CopD family protein [Anaerolineaceae bacterium]|nr:CopD family protein [Anaerolineaceae bacterium]
MKRLSYIVLFALLLGAVVPVQAHGYIVRSIPEDRVTLERAPTRLQYWFSEDLEPDFSSLIVRDQTGNVVAEGGVSPDDASLLLAQLPIGLPDGAYIAELRTAFASDGHVVVETRVFFVGEEVGGVTGSAASDQANGLEVIWRGMIFVSLALLFGVFTLYANVLVPAWGSPDHRAGLLPPRLMRRLSILVIIGFALAFAGHILAIIQQTMVFFNASPAQVIEQGLWQVVRVGSRFGDLWGARLLFLGIAAATFGLSYSVRNDQPETMRPSWTANAWVLALALGTISAGSHAVGSAVSPWLGVVVDWLHLAAVGLWVGGLVVLVLVLPVALRPYEGDTRRLALLAVLNRFSWMAAGALVIVISTGIYSASTWFTAPEDVQSTFGGALAVKLLMVAGLVGLGVAHHITLRPERYARWQGIIGRRFGKFTSTLRLEAVFAVLALLATGLLTATPVPIPATAENAAPPPSQTVTLINDLAVTLTISPGGPGVNTYDVLITQEGQPADNWDVRMQVAHPASDQRGMWEIVEPVESGLYVLAGDEISETGQWWTLLDITQGDTVQRAAFDWAITDDAAVATSRPFSALNVLGVTVILMAIGWVLLPPARRLYHRLDLSPAALTIAFGSVILTVVVLAFASAAIQESQAQYEAILNPPPVVVNTVLPDAASLGRGENLYSADCAWGDHPDALRGLLDQLERARDDELFLAIRDGRGDLPACSGELTGDQRWDIVNFLRWSESTGGIR